MVNYHGEYHSLSDGDGVNHRYGSINSYSETSIVHASIVGGSFISNDDDAPTTTPKREDALQSPLASNEFDDNDSNLLLLRGEMAGMANLAAPVVLTYFLEMLPGIVTLILVGHTEMAHDNDGNNADNDNSEDDDNERKLRLDAASLAVMFTNVVALSPAYGESVCCCHKIVQSKTRIRDNVASSSNLYMRTFIQHSSIYVLYPTYEFLFFPHYMISFRSRSLTVSISHSLHFHIIIIV